MKKLILIGACLLSATGAMGQDNPSYQGGSVNITNGTQQYIAFKVSGANQILTSVCQSPGGSVSFYFNAPLLGKSFTISSSLCTETKGTWSPGSTYTQAGSINTFPYEIGYFYGTCSSSTNCPMTYSEGNQTKEKVLKKIRNK